MTRFTFALSILISMSCFGEGGWHRVDDNFRLLQVETQTIEKSLWEKAEDKGIERSKKLPYTFQYFFESPEIVKVIAICGHLDLSEKDLSKLVFVGDGGGSCFIRARYNLNRQKVLGLTTNARR